jgi:protein-tyrosine-phosphatase
MARRYITFVCTGNICRSPMAERLVGHALAAEEGCLRTLVPVSCGVAAYAGEPASGNSLRALQAVGLSLDDHRSRPVTQELLDETLVLFGMTGAHLRALRSQFDRLPPHVYLMREFVPEGASREIPDPYGCGLADYEECRDAMIEAIPGIMRFLRELAAKEAPPSAE